MLNTSFFEYTETTSESIFGCSDDEDSGYESRLQAGSDVQGFCKKIY